MIVGSSTQSKYRHHDSASYSTVSHTKVSAKSQIPKIPSTPHMLQLGELKKIETGRGYHNQ